MTDRYQRKKSEASLADLAPEVLKLVPQLSDEEWARRDAEIAAERAAVELRDRSKGRLEALLEYGFPRRAVEIVRAGVASEPAIERLRSHVTASQILVVSGPKGIGKTVAATWWAAQRRDRVGFVRASSFASSSRYDREARADMLAHPLVLDDLGAEFVDTKGSFATDLDELIDVFYSDLRPLVITTNCTGEQFRSRYGERIADRLRECGRWINLTGESLRPRAAQPQPKATT